MNIVVPPLPMDQWTKVSGQIWTSVDGAEGVEYLTLADDGEVRTRLTRFAAGANTTALGAVVHVYREEVFIISGRLYDSHTDEMLMGGMYINRSPDDAHGPFMAEMATLVLEMATYGTASQQ